MSTSSKINIVLVKYGKHPVVEDCLAKEQGKGFTLDVFDESVEKTEFGVSLYPTLILFKDGKEIGRTLHFHSEAALFSWLELFGVFRG